MQNRYGRRLEELDAFKVMKLLARANALEEAGMQVIHMEVGEPDFPSPGPILEAARQALIQGRTRYTPADGIPELKQLVSEYYCTRLNIEVPTERIFITAGGSGALLMVSALLLNSGEGLLMTDPGYPCNRHFLKAFHGQGQLLPVTSDDHYQLSAALVRKFWERNTRGVLLASPANPTGAVIEAKVLEGIVDEVHSRNGFVVMDEIYQGLVYGDRQPETALSITDDVFVVNSFSKYFGMTGWRLGWLVVPEDAVSLVEKLAQNLFICPSSIAQYAALAAFSDASRSIMEAQRREFQRRRDFLVPALKELGFSVPKTPDGAFYVYAGLPPGMDDSESFCERLLEEQYVAVTPGTDFGFYLAHDHVRFTYAQPVERLAEAVARMKRTL